MPHDGLPVFRSVRDAYLDRVADGDLTRDERQIELAGLFDRLIGELKTKRVARKSSALGWLFGKKRDAHAPVRGLYLHGGVGRGKTMLMDLFFELAPVKRKRRAHFNDFMADVHDRIGRHREALKRGDTKEADPIPVVAAALAGEAWVLCFDEFTVTDIADAMILSRLFTALFERGVVLVATSNVAPDDLYRDGLNRGLFLPFVSILKGHCEIVPLDGQIDYRMEKLGRMPVYIAPCDEAGRHLMDDAWSTASSGHLPGARTILVKGREVAVPLAAGRAARFDFADLCAKPLGARDYLAIAAEFDTILIDCVPKMGLDRRNEAKRFILLVDTLYDRRVRLIMSAEALPDQLYSAKTGTEKFEFDRTVSRLIEMQSADWATVERAA
ncbi:cell division protein ZapE [Aliihoeflea aestuarii]|jgi:cell division protein ZapE|uniref:cell division protein ZapE n=1 Tax=Aliihoeflea aestuarii TaxID=453840 RepID=UPI0020938ECC|nr:cell division protein ZapE [Aliihoeflea aestuarii]MCO6391260.1 cell division protein ZapE [Aliihoeflea aestuarii]